jgi:3-isopropylmalate/(R)-2-methylmalate dehydratase small subunit
MSSLSSNEVSSNGVASKGVAAAAFPAGPVRCLAGRAVAVVGNDIDTDRIIPARFLKCVSFEGLAAGAFADDRSELAGAHPFDRPEHQGATILVVNDNFGCGSSREHAPQALMRWGIRALIGESFAEIFFGNCLALGIPCLTAAPAAVAALQRAIAAQPAALLTLDVEALRLQLDPPAPAPAPAPAAAGVASAPLDLPLQLAAGPHRMLVSGQWDGTSQLVAHDLELRATAARLPYLQAFLA